MRSKRAMFMFVAAVLSLLVAAPLFSDNAQGSPGDVPSVDSASGINFSLSANTQGITDLYAGRSIDFDIIVTNDSGTTQVIEFMGTCDEFNSKGRIETIGRSNEPILLEHGDSVNLHLRVIADRHLGSVKNIGIELHFAAYDPVVGYDPNTDICKLVKFVDIYSGRASENQFNKIMGIFDNLLPSPMDTAIYAAAATLLIWLVIALFVTGLLIPLVIMPLLIRDCKDERRDTARKIRKPVFFILLLYGVTVCVAVMGADEYMVRTVEMIAMVIYVIFGAWIALKLYTAFLNMLDRRKSEDKHGDVPPDSLTPLFLMVGKIVIGMVAVGVMLAVLGFDTMIIATGAGIIGLAISFGAQSTLAQFFSGFTLLLNRPFVSGDMVRIDNSTDTLIVLNVGFMMTTFRNWANSEIFTMPNQKVVSSTIVNVTAESLTYRIVVLVRVPYTANVTLAKKLALEAMTEHPRILQDGSEEIPKVRFEDFADSSVTIRVSGFVDDFDDHRSIAGDIRERIFTKFLENEIPMAIPKMDVYVRNPSGEDRIIDP